MKNFEKVTGSVATRDRISESVRAYAYLILSSQASARSRMTGNTASALTTQKALLNNFEDIVNRRVDIQEDIKHYQDTLNYASSKADYSMAENIYMLPIDMNLKIKTGTIGYNNKILVSDGKFSLEKNDKVNALELTTMKSPSHLTTTHILVTQTTTTRKCCSTETNYTHEQEKIALILSLTGAFTIWYMFQ